MHRHERVTIDDDDDDNDDDDNEQSVKQEVTDTIEKFVQSRHVQTLKYLRHVIDENRQLRLHIDRLKRYQDERLPPPPPPPPPPTVQAQANKIDTEEISTETEPIPEQQQEENTIEFNENLTQEILEKPFVNIELVDQATNTEKDESESQYNLLNEELTNLKKQHNINREEFRRELDRVDAQNTQFEKDLKSTQQQLIIAQRRNQEKQAEIHNLATSLADERLTNEALTIRVNNLDQTNERLTQSFNQSEIIRLDLESQVRELRRIFQEDKQKLFEIQVECRHHEQQVQISEQEIASLKQKLDEQFDKNQQLNDENEVLKENIKYLQIQLQDKVLQEQEFNRERQLNSNFKDFVQTKRVLQQCQQENEQLKVEIRKLQLKLVNKND
ncbi:unnamed protein product [Adineta ricciae]|uniref:Uncharacterized protein n=1 Tax=Adineta ricciae TaxID=249248 RepID=A0A813U876_ADIRI|nr:unnamed protein product [Adineta ricciae]CAF0933076.1 unnamed protein product [Adineta ricciae]